MTNLPQAGQTANQRSGCSGSEQVRLVLRGGQGSEQEGLGQFMEIRITSCCTLLETMTRLPL